MISGAATKNAGEGRLISIQFMRFVSALLVVALHQAYAFGDYIGRGLNISAIYDPGTHAGNIAVCGFFIISGYIMVVSSRHLFAAPGAMRIFWTRRAVRVLPPYWIATFVLVAIVMILRGGSFDSTHLAKSLALWPYWTAGDFTLALPIMWVGWTLFFEMVFYFLFGLFVAFRRPVAIGLTVLALVALVAAGQVFQPQNAPLWMATRPVALVFIAGMVLALWRERGHTAPGFVRWAALVLAVAIPLLLDKPIDYAPVRADYLLWAAIPGILLSFAVMGGEIRWPRPALVDRLGDISFALYLLHVPAAHFWTFVWQALLPPGGAWGFMVTLIIGTVIVSWLFFLWVERPMTRFLNVKFGAAQSPVASPVAS